MVDLSDFTPEQLQDYLKWAKGDQGAQDASSQANDILSERYSRLGQQADQPIAKLGDVLDPNDFKSPAIKAREAAQAKLDAAAQGTSSDSVITDTPPTRRFEAMDKMNQAAQGTSNSTPINPDMEFPTNPGYERMASPQELATLPTNKGTSLAENTIKEAMPATPDKAMEAAVDANAVKSASTGSSFLDNLLAKIPREKINSILGKKLFETEGAESAGLDLLKAGSKKEMLQAGAKLAGAGTDAAISAGGQMGLKGLSLLGRAAGPLGGADLASSALANGDTSPEQRDYQKGISENEAKELGLPDSAAQGKDPGKGLDLLNIPGSFDNTKLSPEEQAQVDKFGQLLEAKKKAGMLPYQNPDESMVQDAGNKDKSLFDMVHNQYQTQQANGNVGNSTASSGGTTLAKSSDNSDDGDSPSRTPAVENARLQGPSITDQFAQAQSAANMGALTAQLGKAGALIGSGIGAGITKPTAIDDKIFDTNLAVSQQIPQQFLQKLEVSKLDPASDMSQAARDFLQKSIGITVPDNISAAQLKEQFPVIEKLLAARENAKMRQFMAMENLKMREAALEMSNRHFEKNYNLRETNLGNRVVDSIKNDKTVQRTDQRIQSINKAQEIVDGGGVLTPNLLSDSEQDVLSAMTGSASPAVGKLNKIEFKSLQRDGAKFLQYLNGAPIDMKTADPELVKSVSNVIQLLKTAYLRDKMARIEELKNQKIGMFQDTNPRISKALEGISNQAKDAYATGTAPAPLTAPSAPTSGLVTIRRKKDGVTKTLPADRAQPYLSDNGYERVN